MLKKFAQSLGSGYLDSLGRASTMGLHLVSGLLVGGGIGYGLDYWLDTPPWFFIFFILIGIAAGFKNVYTDTKRLLESQKQQDAYGQPREGQQNDPPHIPGN